MPDFSGLKELIEAKEWGGNLAMPFKSVQIDSRKVSPGDIFVAVIGHRTDGHHYIRQAVEKGAGGVILERKEFAPETVPWIRVEDSRLTVSRLAAFLYDYPSSRLHVIGVTGTNGKTTTVFLIEKLLCTAGKKVGLIGTIENRIAGKPLETKFTTPDALELHQLFSRMLDEGVTDVVMEVSSHALALHRVADCEFGAAVFTNLTQDHLDFHESAEDYFHSKARLFKHLGTASEDEPKYAVVNLDSPYAEDIIKVTKVPVVTYGINHGADISASNINISHRGTAFSVSGPDFQLDLKLKLVGRFNVYNALAACAVGYMEKIDPETIRMALEETGGIPGRFENIDEGQPFGVIVDYAHTPDGLKNILETAREITAGRVITVFGCGGDRDRGKRPLMGEAAAGKSDFCIITSDNPRSEVPGEIIKDILPGVTKLTRDFRIIENRREAIKEAIGMAGKGDLVVIAGKGHETYQIIGKEVFPFNDREEARIALRSMGYGGYTG